MSKHSLDNFHTTGVCISTAFGFCHYITIDDMLAVFNVLHISHRINLLEISCVFPCNEQMVEKRLWGEGGNIVNNTSCDSLYLNNLESKRVNSKSTLIQRTPTIIILNTTEKDVVQWMTRTYSGKKNYEWS